MTEIKVCTKCGASKPLSDFGKHSKSKDGLNSFCKACKSLAAAAHYRTNSEAIREKTKAYALENRDSVLAQKKVYAEENRDRLKAAKAKWAEENAEHLQAYQADYYSKNTEVIRASQAEYQRNNRPILNAINASWAKRNRAYLSSKYNRLRARDMGAIPAWADFEAIELIYVQANDLSKQSGVVHHVDHIVPLRSKLVCGLHCEANLQVITGAENQSKHNRIWPDMP